MMVQHIQLDVHVAHRVDDLEICFLRARHCIAVAHRPDDLEISLYPY